MSTKISALIISYNEELHIGKCLDSLQSVADEILVLDSYSSDETVKIAESKNARVVSVKWEGYSDTKNKGHELAKFPYILSIDADEVLDEEMQESINAASRKGLSGAYCFKRKNFIGSHWIRYGGWYPDKKTRLFPKESRWKGKVHESIVIPENINVRQLNGNLIHYSYQSIDELKEKASKYARIWAEEKSKAGKGGSLLKGHIKRSIKFFEMYLIKLGFLDGKFGLILATVTAKERYLRQKHLVALNKQNS